MARLLKEIPHLRQPQPKNKSEDNHGNRKQHVEHPVLLADVFVIPGGCVPRRSRRAWCEGTKAKKKSWWGNVVEEHRKIKGEEAQTIGQGNVHPEGTSEKRGEKWGRRGGDWARRMQASRRSRGIGSKEWWRNSPSKNGNRIGSNEGVSLSCEE